MLNKKDFFRYGLPFLALIIGGSFGLQQFSQIRYQFRRVTNVLPQEEAEALNMKKPGEVTIESEYEKIKDMDLNNWEPIRGPRPWENQ